MNKIVDICYHRCYIVITMEKNSYIRIRLSGEEKKLLERKAVEVGLSMSGYIRALIGDGFIQPESMGDVAEDEGWVGPVFKDNKLNKKIYES